jgi:hypothetical protein
MTAQLGKQCVERPDRFGGTLRMVPNRAAHRYEIRACID